MNVMSSIQTASPLELTVLTLLISLVGVVVWRLAGLWQRMWVESIESRSIDRRFMRWQRFAFRGHYPLGHWRKPGAVARLNAFTIFVRVFVVLALGLYFFAVARRVVTWAQSPGATSSWVLDCSLSSSWAS
jgi:hypothetical protein